MTHRLASQIELFQIGYARQLAVFNVAGGCNRARRDMQSWPSGSRQATPIVCWSKAISVFEAPDKVTAVVDSDSDHDLFDAQERGFQ